MPVIPVQAVDGTTVETLVEDWQTPRFANTWANLGAPWENAAFFKDLSGVVHLRGHVNAGTLNTAVFTLPLGFRPFADQRFPCIATTAGSYVYVKAVGNVEDRGRAAAADFISLDGVTFRAYR